jgi:hypothetical protein
MVCRRSRCCWWLVVAVVGDVGRLFVGVALPDGDARPEPTGRLGPMMLGVVEETLDDYIKR